MKYLLSAFALMVLTISAPSFAQTGIDTPAKQAIIIDASTGTVLMEKNADEHMPTSSMSKVMTIYMVFDALKNGTIKLDDTFPVSEKAWKMGGSKMFVDINTNVKVEDLIRGVIVQSGNDATIVLAEGLAGSEISFADAMNKKAKELGMNESNFMNASGWPDENHYSTARDLARLGYAMIRDFPDYYKYYSELDFTYHGIKQGNRNPLLYRNVGADGIKTGHTEAAGYGLIGSAVSGDRRVIMVVNGLSSMQERADESVRLIEWALQGFANKTLIKKDQIVGEAKVAYGQQAVVPLAASEDVVVTLPKLSKAPAKIEVSYKGPLVAPLKKGQEVGVVRITAEGMGAPREMPLVVAADVAEQGFFAKTMSKAKHLLAGGV